MAAPVRWGGGYQIGPPVARRDTEAIAPKAGSTDFATMNKPEWRISDGAVPYAEALAVMEGRVADIRAGRGRELVWLLEHPPPYTAGTSAQPHDLLQPMRFPVHVARRGGRDTHHRPRQPVGLAVRHPAAPPP